MKITLDRYGWQVHDVEGGDKILHIVDEQGTEFMFPFSSENAAKLSHKMSSAGIKVAPASALKGVAGKPS